MSQKGTVKYIGFYDSSHFLEERRNYNLAATNKMDYIASSIVKAGYNVHFISPSWSANGKGWYKKRTTDIGDGIRLTVGPTFGARNWLTRKLRIGWSWLWLFLYLVLNTNRGEKVIAYHALMMDFPLLCAKFVKRFELILEVEEEYCVVIKQPSFFEWLEKKIIKCADYHILSTDLMAEAYAYMNKRNIVIYGNYAIHDVKKRGIRKDAVLIVYAGIIDSVKAGAFNAIKVAKYLDSRYRIHIIGFGNADDIQHLTEKIGESNIINACKIKYDGKKEGKDYINYLSQFDIGLSTQVASGEYLKFSFPSKILSYMGVGLRVVTSRIDCVERSKISDFMVYYDEDEPMAIAKAIMAINCDTPSNARERLLELDKQFVLDIKALLEK
jgi:glycosyltransferase involved in cell wall biosynthesis